MHKNKENDIKFLMDHPVFIMHDNAAKIVRVQLFFLSISSIFLAYSGVSVGEGSSILGIRLEGLKNSHIFWLTSFLVAYQMIHFLWSSWESFCEWRIRQSALDSGGIGGSGIKITKEDEGLKIRQTTIYSYLNHTLGHDLNNLRKEISSFNESEAKDKAKKIESHLNDLYRHLKDPRIINSLWRFDNWFKMFCRAQNIRWLILEVSLPVALGIWALTLSLSKAIIYLL